MTTLTTRLKTLRWYQWTFIVLALLYVLYVALSYLYLPGKLKQVVETDVSELVGRDITVARFEYNPFDLSLRVFGLNVPDKPDAPLVAFDQFYVNFTPWGSLFNWGIKLEALQLDQPEINIEKHGDRFNFSDIVDRFASDEPEAPAEPDTQTAMALEIIRTAINDGVFRFTDFSGNKPARSEMDDITIVLQDLYLATGDDHLNPFNITAQIPGGGTLKLAGQYRVDPLYVETSVDAQGVELKEFSDFVYNVVPMTVTDGRLALSGSVLAQQQGEDVSVTISGADLSVTQLALDDAVLDPPMVRVGEIALTGIEFDLLGQSLSVNALRVVDPVGNQWLDEHGDPRFKHLLVEKVVQENVEQHEAAQQPVPEEEAEPWSVVVNTVALKNGLLHFSDQQPGIVSGHSVSAVNVNLENLTLAEGETVPVNVTARLDDQGELTVTGSMTLVPFAMQMQYGLANLPLPSFSEYVELATYLRIEKGALNVDGNIALDTEGEVPITTELAVQVDGFQAEDTRTGKPVVAFKQLQLTQIQLDTQAQNVQVGAVTLTEPDMLLTIGAEGDVNWATITKDSGDSGSEGSAEAASEAAPTEDTAEATPPWHFALSKIEIKNGLTRFEDRSVKPTFKTGLHNLMFTLDEVSSQRTEPTPFTLTSKIDRYAPFNVKGTLDPIDQQPGFEFTSQLTGLDMPSLSPYSAAFIAHNLRSGKLKLDLDYELHDRHLEGKNNVVADQLYLGEKVPSEDAIDAPVALGLALLRDVHGVIDLDVGIAGDLDDPGFSVSGIILKAFVNVLVKAATSPFQLLGSLVPGGEDMGSIEFEPGLAELSEASQESLKTLVDALAQRPQLLVRIDGSALPADDTPMLKKLRIQDRVAERRKMSLEELREEAGDVDWWTVRANRKAITAMNKELKLPDEDAREEALQAQNPELKGDDLEAAVYQGMYEDVSQQQDITQTDLLALADRRALAIKQYLVDGLQFDHHRVVVDKTHSSALSSRTITLELDAK